MLSFGFILAILIELLVPFGLAIWFIRKFGTNWKLFGVGVLTFIASQIVHLPMLFGIDALNTSLLGKIPTVSFNIMNAVLLGLAAGICEETARWVGFKILKARASKFGASLTVGAGHGGIESIIIGISLLVNYALFMIISSGKGNQFGVPVEMQYSMAQQMFAYLSMPWFLPLIGAAERLFAITLHLALSVMVWQAFKNRSWGWFIGAVLWHAFIDGATVLMSTYQFNLWVIEGVVAVMAVANAFFIIWFGRRQFEIEAEESEETSLDEGEVVEGELLPASEAAPVEESAPVKKPRKTRKTSADSEQAPVEPAPESENVEDEKPSKSLYDDEAN